MSSCGSEDPEMAASGGFDQISDPPQTAAGCTSLVAGGLSDFLGRKASRPSPSESVRVIQSIAPISPFRLSGLLQPSESFGPVGSFPALAMDDDYFAFLL